MLSSLDSPKILNITIFSEEFNDNNVTITLEWSPWPAGNSLASYNVNIYPQTAITFIGDSMVELTVPYNTLYNVSISESSAPIHCGQNTMSATSIILNYSECYTVFNMCIK